uniref:Amidohydrolase-related domain-containing protein n=1 Tax=Meloidogyne incognita TaxID=6306 RepID=A0A914MGP3_MELIC
MKSNIKKGKNEQQVDTSTVIPELALSVNPKLDPKDDFRGKIITAKWVWFNGSFQQNVLLKIDKDGKIEDIFKEDHELFTIEEGKIVDLGEMALLPGFVNAHSHAFHRELRGLSQIGNEGADNFWKWRQNMYKLVEDIDYEKLKKICIDTFSEMLSVGITTVGEFHYVHHSNKASSDGFFDLDMAVIEAACEVGIRLVLIETLYMRAGFSQSEINPEQWRFSSATVEQFIERVEDLREKLKNNDLVTLALAVHSLRAVPIPEAIKLYKYARQNNLPLHLHLEEQPAELDDCRLVNEGKDPAEVLLQNILENGETEEIDNSLITAVHCTHTKRSNLDEFVKRKINVCICPCTEGYLGDGIPNLSEFDNICLGTDCNNRIAMFEEMRWLAFCQNMRTNCRNCAYLSAQKLLECATINGAKSLGIWSKIGNFVIGKQMDFFGILLKNFKLKNFCDDKKLLDSLIFGGGNEEIGMTGIGGIVKFNK